MSASTTAVVTASRWPHSTHHQPLGAVATGEIRQQWLSAVLAAQGVHAVCGGARVLALRLASR